MTSKAQLRREAEIFDQNLERSLDSFDEAMKEKESKCAFRKPGRAKRASDKRSRKKFRGGVK